MSAAGRRNETAGGTVSPVLAVCAAVLLLAACGGEAEAMKITFQQSGGFAATLPGKSCVLDTAGLAANDAKHLQSLVEGSGFLTMDGGQWKSERGADLQTYEITIQSEAGTKRYSFDDMTVPEKAYPLLEYLQGRCE